MNYPDKIYLNTGYEADSVDFHELFEVTWSENKVHSNDIAYISKDSLLSFLCSRIKEIEHEKSTINTNTMAGGNKINRLRGIQKELKQIIETFK